MLIIKCNTDQFKICYRLQMEGRVNTGFEDEKSGGGGGGGLLAPDNSALNSHTYVYEPDKSLRKMTIEALPTADNYQVLTLSDA